MTDRPIIFSAPMVRALLDKRKTQTRRLATSPLRKCKVGDRLYVREAFYLTEGGEPIYRSCADEGLQSIVGGMAKRYKQKWTPSIHMPRWASRLTLIVEDVKVEPLQAISEADALAEGIANTGPCPILARPLYQGAPGLMHCPEPAEAYRHLWSALHTDEGQRWEDNPDVIALSFRVVRGNIDQVPA